MITYILTPVELDTDFLVDWATKHNCNVVVFYGMDWNNDLTPWIEPNVNPSEAPFQGKASEFLSFLQQQAIPAVEKAIGYSTAPARYLVGISLAGLFALWAWMQDDFFKSICSISGSLWYIGFVDWLQSLPMPHKDGGAYFSLGKDESHSANPLFNTVGSATNQAISILNAGGISTAYEENPGSHKASPMPRIGKALDFIAGCA